MEDDGAGAGNPSLRLRSNYASEMIERGNGYLPPSISPLDPDRQAPLST